MDQCDVAGFSDYNLLETAIRSRYYPENHAICSDVWKRHLLAPAAHHTNIQDQGRRQQETHTPIAKTVYKKNDCSPTARHRIRNEKRAKKQREFHYTSSDVLSNITRAYQSLQIHSYLSHTAVLARGLIGTCVGPNPLQPSQLFPP